MTWLAMATLQWDWWLAIDEVPLRWLLSRLLTAGYVLLLPSTEAQEAQT